MRKYICEGLATYLAKEYRPWHMPGHKRKNFGDELLGEADIDMAAFSSLNDWELTIDTGIQLVQSFDVTELPETDDLHHPEDMIQKSQMQLSEIYGTLASYYMVNGSTGGILAAIGAVASIDKKTMLDSKLAISDTGKKRIIIARNCHKSVFNACEIFGLEPVYIEPEYLKLKEIGNEKKDIGTNNSYIYGDIKPLVIKELLEANQDVVAVVITSPTYEGVISDVEGIKKILEPYNIPLIVDEAHGAHLPFIDELPKSAVSLGADIVVQSLHKTLPSLTQTAILHVNNGELDGKVRKYLSMFMSSSPSYVMLCSMERAVVNSWERKTSGHGYREYLNNLKAFREKVSNLQNIKLVGATKDLDQCERKSETDNFFAYDETRIVLYSKITGESLAKMLRDLGEIEVEMSGTNYVVLISTYKDNFKDIDRLRIVLSVIDEKIAWADMLEEERQRKSESSGDNSFSRKDLDKLVGTVAENNIYVYPPGSYIVTAGEVISQSAVDKIKELKESGKNIVGLEGV